MVKKQELRQLINENNSMIQALDIMFFQYPDVTSYMKFDTKFLGSLNLSFNEILARTADYNEDIDIEPRNNKEELVDPFKMEAKIKELFTTMQKFYSRPEEVFHDERALETVYVTKSGKLFHRQECGYLSRSRDIYPIPRFGAIKEGYQACRCTRKRIPIWCILLIVLIPTIISMIALIK